MTSIILIILHYDIANVEGEQMNDRTDSYLLILSRIGYGNTLKTNRIDD